MSLPQKPSTSSYDRGVVSCVHCAAPMYVYRLKPLADEFSVRCPRCGKRAVYTKQAVGVESVRERRRTARD